MQDYDQKRNQTPERKSWYRQRNLSTQRIAWAAEYDSFRMRICIGGRYIGG